MRRGDKKVLFGSMVETTSGADDGSHFLTKDVRNARTAMKQPSGGAKARGMSQAPSVAQKKLNDQPDFKKGYSHQSKLLQSRQNR